MQNAIACAANKLALCWIASLVLLSLACLATWAGGLWGDDRLYVQATDHIWQLQFPSNIQSRGGLYRLPAVSAVLHVDGELHDRPLSVVLPHLDWPDSLLWPDTTPDEMKPITVLIPTNVPGAGLAGHTGTITYNIRVAYSAVLKNAIDHELSKTLSVAIRFYGSPERLRVLRISGTIMALGGIFFWHFCYQDDNHGIAGYAFD